MEATEQLTCGKGLAENSLLPALLSNVIAAMAENLSVHKKALDMSDPNSQAEYDAYERLIREMQQSAAGLRAIATEMASYRDLPMGRHDVAAMTQPEVRQMFDRLLTHKQRLLSLLQETSERDAQLLARMQQRS